MPLMSYYLAQGHLILLFVFIKNIVRLRGSHSIHKALLVNGGLTTLKWGLLVIKWHLYAGGSD